MPFKVWASPRALRSSAAVVTVCASLTEGVKRQAGDVPVFQIEDPPLAERETLPTDVVAVKRDLGLSDRPVVLYSGHFESYQGVEVLVDASGRVPEAQFLFMGGELAQWREWDHDGELEWDMLRWKPHRDVAHDRIKRRSSC